VADRIEAEGRSFLKRLDHNLWPFLLSNEEAVCPVRRQLKGDRGSISERLMDEAGPVL
jgi:hypothetical protein